MCFVHSDQKGCVSPVTGRVVVTMLLVAVLTGCAADRQLVQAGNPVDVMRAAGCTLDVDTRYGDQAVDGTRFGNCAFGPDDRFTRITVWTYPDEHAVDQALGETPRRDQQVIIAGQGFLLELHPGPHGVYDPTPREVATRVGGTVVPQ